MPAPQELATSLGVTGDLAAICRNETVVAEVLKDVQAACKGGKLQKFEVPTKVR